jgi:hypothetical protein
LNPHSGLGPQYPGILKKGHVLPAGSSGTILREQSGWKEIAFSQDQRGWIPKASAQEIYKY